MSIRAKFFVSKLTNPDGATAAQVELGAVCRGVENAIWSSATPSGYISMSILNTPAFEQFEYGAEYLVTFTKVAKPMKGDGHKIQPVTNKYGYFICEFCGLQLSGVPQDELDDDYVARHDEFYSQTDE